MSAELLDAHTILVALRAILRVPEGGSILRHAVTVARRAGMSEGKQITFASTGFSFAPAYGAGFTITDEILEDDINHKPRRSKMKKGSLSRIAKPKVTNRPSAPRPAPLRVTPVKRKGR